MCSADEKARARGGTLSEMAQDKATKKAMHVAFKAFFGANRCTGRVFMIKL
jgi:hypothetical protein